LKLVVNKIVFGLILHELQVARIKRVAIKWFTGEIAQPKEMMNCISQGWRVIRTRYEAVYGKSNGCHPHIRSQVAGIAEGREIHR